MPRRYDGRHSAVLSARLITIVETSSWSVEPLLDRSLAGAPESPHPRGRHDPFEDILARSAFADMQRVEVTYNAEVSLTADALLGFYYSVSHVEVCRSLFDRQRQPPLVVCGSTRDRRCEWNL